MKHSTFDLKSRDGIHRAQSWEPDGEPRGVVCLVHGFGEHGGRYAHVGAHLGNARYALLTFDLRGHGKSHGRRGHTPSYDHLMDDITLLLEQAARRFPHQPRFLYGHSMGGNLALNYALRRHPALAGVIATSPWLRLTYAPPGYLITLGKVMNRVMPTFTQAANLDTQGLSRDAEIVRAYENDPFVHNRISARLSMSIIESGEWALAHAADLHLPLLITHGTADRLTSFEASREFARQVQKDCTFKLWEGFYHETHNEPEKEQVLDFTVEWLNAHAPDSSGAPLTFYEKLDGLGQV